MTWTKPDISYWNNKFAAYWHDPIDKVLSIQKHEERAAAYLQIFGIDR
jgi:CRISPR-associated protein Cmr2